MSASIVATDSATTMEISLLQVDDDRLKNNRTQLTTKLTDLATYSSFRKKILLN